MKSFILYLVDFVEPDPDFDCEVDQETEPIDEPRAVGQPVVGRWVHAGANIKVQRLSSFKKEVRQ